MIKAAAVLSALVISAIVMQPVLAGMFSIYIVYQNGNPASNAYVEIWQGDSKIDSGNADDDGIFWTFLREGGTYHITAKASNGQTASWDGLAYGTLLLNNSTYKSP
jgi:hypothetical protein